ncbi:MAG: type I-B CRISPR-associated protein Cas8b1/Cst1 [Chlorobium sp.]
MSHLFEYTGNPFVDAGISALMVWSEKKHPQELTEEDVRKALPEIATLFSQGGWVKTFYTTFSNGVMVQPSNKGKEREKWLEFIGELVKELQPLGDQGSCVACGRRNPVRIKKEKRGFLRSEVPMTSGSLNYYSYASSGADYCGVCAMAIQVSPLVLYRSGGKMILVHSSSEKAMRSWAKTAIKDIHAQIGLNRYSGCFTENFKNPQNALFQIAKKLSQDKEDWANEPVAIRIYHFTNYGQGAELGYYDLPAKIFHFLNEVQYSEEAKDWEKIIRKRYYFKKGQERIWLKTDDKLEEDYKDKKNAIYEGLLGNKWIVKYFYGFQQRKSYARWALVQLYLKEVRQMDKQRIETIKRVADEIVLVIQKDGSDKPKRLGQLERANTYGNFRNTLRLIIKERIGNGAENPLFSLDDYAERLFPDGALGWRETQDLILFRLYEVLHNWLKEKGIVIDEVEENRHSEVE